MTDTATVDDPFRAIDEVLDFIDNRYPRRNFPCTEQDKDIIRPKLTAAAFDLKRIFRAKADHWYHVEGWRIYNRHRDEALRIMADIARLELDMDVTYRPEVEKPT